MNNSQRLSLVGATLRSGLAVMHKSASAGETQREVLEASWPTGAEEQGLTKRAELSQILATGMLVEEAEATS